MRLPAGLRALASRDFCVYYAGNFIAQTGSWMQTIAQSWLVLQLTGSPFLLGLTATLQSGPILLLSVFAGIAADRLPKRNILIVTQAIQGALACTLGVLVWTGHVRYGHVATMAVLWGITNALDQPTRQAFIMELVGRQDVASAVGLSSASFNAARIVGPAVAGVLIARIGLFSGFVLNALAFVVAIAALTRIAVHHPLPRTGVPFLPAIAEGVAYAARTPAVRFILIMQVIVSFCVFNFTVYVPLLAQHVLGLGSEGFGLLMTALGVGAVVAGFALGGIAARQLRPALIAGALILACAGLLGLSAMRAVPLAALLLGVVGLTGTVVTAGCNTSLQLMAPDRLRGRVMSLYTVLSSGVFPIGAFWVGFVSDAWGVAPAFAVNGLLGLVALGVAAWMHRSGRATVSERL